MNGYDVSPHGANAGGGTVIWNTDGPQVDAVPFR
jgi:hypothetical protein